MSYSQDQKTLHKTRFPLSGLLHPHFLEVIPVAWTDTHESSTDTQKWITVPAVVVKSTDDGVKQTWN